MSNKIESMTTNEILELKEKLVCKNIELEKNLKAARKAKNFLDAAKINSEISNNMLLIVRLMQTLDNQQSKQS